MSGIYKISKPDSTLKKNYNEIAYHAIFQSMAMGETLTGCIRSEDNPADLLTKIVIGYKHRHLVSLVLYDIYDIYDGDTQQWASVSFPILANPFQELDTLLKGLEGIGHDDIV